MLMVKRLNFGRLQKAYQHSIQKDVQVYFSVDQMIYNKMEEHYVLTYLHTCAQI